MAHLSSSWDHHTLRPIWKLFGTTVAVGTWKLRDLSCFNPRYTVHPCISSKVWLYRVIPCYTHWNHHFLFVEVSENTASIFPDFSFKTFILNHLFLGSHGISPWYPHDFGKPPLSGATAGATAAATAGVQMDGSADQRGEGATNGSMLRWKMVAPPMRGQWFDGKWQNTYKYN